ncbi:MAG: hypothetical protein ACJA1R_002506, partial [Flavobacteriales bacterium]
MRGRAGSCDEVLDVVVNTTSDDACDNGLFCDGAEPYDLVLDWRAGNAPALDDWDSCTTDACDEVSDVVTNVGLSGSIATSVSAFAVLKVDGNVVTWGNATEGGDSPSGTPKLTGIVEVFSTVYAFAALKSDGSVVTWGNSSGGGDSSSVTSEMTNVAEVFSTNRAFAALKSDGGVVTWGNSHFGGDSSSITDEVTGVADVFCTYFAFAALKSDGSVVTWGDSTWGGDSSSVASDL